MTIEITQWPSGLDIEGMMRRKFLRGFARKIKADIRDLARDPENFEEWCATYVKDVNEWEFLRRLRPDCAELLRRLMAAYINHFRRRGHVRQVARRIKGAIGKLAVDCPNLSDFDKVAAVFPKGYADGELRAEKSLRRLIVATIGHFRRSLAVAPHVEDSASLMARYGVRLALGMSRCLT
jgi:hypothetical protein